MLWNAAPVSRWSRGRPYAKGEVRMPKHSGVTSLLSAATLAVAFPAVSHAQDSVAPPEQQASGQIEDIIVTAQKRTENLQNVPVSAQVISGAAIQDRNISSLQTLSQTTPGFISTGGSQADNVYIRGIGAGNLQYFDQAVATFVDDIYHGRSRSSAASFLDLERVEVLKGPQSTFFGNNAIAGALNVITKRPSDHPEGYVRALFGSHDDFGIEGAATVPVNDTLSIRAAGIFEGTDGWIHDVYTGKEAPVRRDVAGRLTILYRPSSDFDATIKVEGSRNRQKGAAYDNPLQLTNCNLDRSVPANVAFLNAYGQGCAVAAASGFPTGLNNNKSEGPAGQGNSLHAYETVATLNYHHWGHTFTSVTGYTHYVAGLSVDQYQAGPVQIAGFFPERYGQFSQEFRVTSPADQRIEYLAGAYYQAGKTFTDFNVNFPGFNGLFQSIPGVSTIVAPYLPLAYDERFHENEKVYALFGSLSWNITSKLKLTGGIRAISDHKSVTANSDYGTDNSTYGNYTPGPAVIQPIVDMFFGHGFGTPVTTGSFKRIDKTVLPSGKLQYQFAPRLMVYASYSRGFLAGGFNGQDTSGSAASVPFKPEYVNAYEIGFKGKFFDNKVLLNLAGFRSDYKSLQVTSILQGTGINVVGATAIRNAGSALSQGVEGEAEWAINSHFRLTADATYLDSHYKSYKNGPATPLQSANGITVQDLSGQDTLYAPEWSASLNAAYTTTLFGHYRLGAELTPYYSASYFLQGGASDDPFAHQRAYVRLDARVTFESIPGHWAIDIIGKNLTDRVILGQEGNPTTDTKQEPISVAAQFRYTW